MTREQIEEKAKRFDEALEKARKRVSTEPQDHTDAILKDIFPELKESEDDEKIRKDIVEAVELHKDFTQERKEHIYAWLEKQGKQKPTDKVKPKFKVGDWIVRDDHLIIGKVISFDGICYWYNDVTCSCSVKQPLFVNDEDRYHIWTIQDAKDGDILTSIGFHNNCTFIFNGLDNWKFDEPNGDRAVATGYCCISASANKMDFGIQGPDCIEVNTIKPATKEQRDILFQKMKEAGYEWDADTKELKKIEHNSIWSEEDEKMKNLIISTLISMGTINLERYHHMNLDEVKNWLKSLKDRMQQPK